MYKTNTRSLEKDSSHTENYKKERLWVLRGQSCTPWQYIIWDETGGLGRKKLEDSQIWSVLYNNEGSPGTSDLPNPGEKNRQNFMNRIFVSLAKILKERLQFLKKPINNLVIMEMANVPYFYPRLCVCLSVCVCVCIHVGGVSVFLSEGKRSLLVWGQGCTLLYLLYGLSF